MHLRRQGSLSLSIALATIALIACSGDSAPAGADASVQPVGDAAVDGVCGELADNEGRCLSASEIEICEAGGLSELSCPAGSECDVDSESIAGISCYCDDKDDGICAGPDCIDDPDCQDALPSTTEQLVPSSLIGVISYDVAGDQLFVVQNAVATRPVIVCPITGCSASPEILDDNVPATADIEAADTHVFWIDTDKRVISMPIDGGTKKTVFIGLDDPAQAPLRAFGNFVFFPHNNVIFGKSEVYAASPTESQSQVPMRRDKLFVGQRIAVGGGKLVSFQNTSSQDNRFRVMDIVTKTVQEVGTESYVKDVQTDGQNLFWIDDDSQLKACPISSCDSPVNVSITGRSLVVHEGRVYFDQVGEGTGNIRSCSILSALAGTCTPQQHVAGFVWLGAKKLKVSDGYIYAMDQFRKSIYRAPL